MTRPASGAARAAALLAATLVFVACGSETSSETDTRTPDTVGRTDTSAPADADASATGTLCCPLGTCPVGNACVQGACLPQLASGQCYFDGQCGTGQTCVGATACACGEEGCTPVKGTCSYGAGCCQSDGDCGGGEVCHEGVCRATPSGACWRDDQCGAGLACEAVTSCPCGVSGCTAAAGHCGVPGVCCAGDAECGVGGVCRGGRCFAEPSGSACFGDDDCATAGDVCRGESLCTCGADASCVVPTTAGRCGAPGGTCCQENSDCKAGELCVEGQGCVTKPPTGRCWVDGHCGAGRVCEGATLCDCEDDTCEAQMGTCRTPVVQCNNSTPCDPGMRCVVPDTTVCPGGDAPTDGVCVPEVDGGCWHSADCVPYLRCIGENICTDPGGCAEPNNAGQCRAPILLKDCCKSHDECVDGAECRNQNTSLTCPPDESAICVPKPIYGESCWNFHDCPDGYVCNRSWMCGCNGKCRWNNQGVCERPRYCQANTDCGTDDICARDPECIASPCSTQSTCNPGGQCQPKVEGRCWTHGECGEGNYCEDLRICPEGRECPYPDAPGECAPKADLGGCCTSYLGCQSGLRCVSVAAKTGCNLDVTSVCVPAITLGVDCYADDDCSAGAHCEGAVVCPCGIDTCTSPPQAGQCVAGPR
ncbi:MAG: hypothetical protein H6745_11770 [Deltaproteobacteria bacterium]|nr:hypothetical protein [Deltaproteobacteria bacterium]